MPGKRPLLVVVDTNVLVSALLGKKLRVLLERLKEDKFELLFSEETLAELIAVLQLPRFEKYLSQDDIEQFRQLLSFHSRLEKPSEKIEACRDPKDNKFLESAVTVRVDYIVTGDQDLLVLNPFRNISIITADQFMKELADPSR